MKIKRGDIVLADLGLHEQGSVQSGVRPCFVIQSDAGNYFSATTIVIPMTKNTKGAYPMHVEVTDNDIIQGNLHQTSSILCEQIRVIEKEKIIKNLGSVHSHVLGKVRRALLISLGYEEKTKLLATIK